jgi:Thymidylate synthase complementing protein
MPYQCSVVTDSVSPSGDRLTTFEVTFPRIVLSEFNTHCALARNSASSRAVPVLRKIRDVLGDPFVPVHFGHNIPGMQAHENLTSQSAAEAERVWLAGRDRAVRTALELIFGSDRVMAELGTAPSERDLQHFVSSLTEADIRSAPLNVHKQIANRVIETFMWHTVIVTATDWSNFFALRTHAGAQPEIREIATLMRQAMIVSRPVAVEAGGWHLPLIQDDERERAARDPLLWTKIAAARCARVSYLTHHGLRDLDQDIALHDRLLRDGHLSPFEHVGQAMTAQERATQQRSGKFLGWHQLRKRIANESDYSLTLAATEGVADFPAPAREPM